MTREANWRTTRSQFLKPTYLENQKDGKETGKASTNRQHRRLHRDQDPKRKDKPRLEILDGLDKLWHGKGRLVATLAVPGHAQGEHLLVARRQEPRVLGTAGHEAVEQAAREHGHGSAHEEQRPPRLQRQGRVSADGIHEQAPDDLGCAVHGDPYAEKGGGGKYTR